MNERITNLSKSIIKRLQLGRDIDEELIYAFVNAVTEKLEHYDEDISSEEYLHLKERIETIWKHESFYDIALDQIFLCGSLWGVIHILEMFRKKQHEQRECRVLVNKYKEDTYFDFLNAIYTKPGIKNSTLAQICDVTPSRISQMISSAKEEGLVVFQKVGREKYYFINNKGTIVYRMLQEERKPQYSIGTQISFSMLGFDNRIQDSADNFLKFAEYLHANKYSVIVAYWENRYQKDIEQGGSEFLCGKKMKVLSNNYDNSWGMQKEIDSIKRPLFIK